MAVQPPPQPVRFDRFEVDLQAGELRRDGELLKLQDKPFQLLAVLLESPGRVITREELRQRLWPADTFVDFEHGLNTAVKKLRQALDDSAEEPQYVQTLPKRGYRFLPPVEPRNATVEDQAGRQPAGREALAADVPVAVPEVGRARRRSAWRLHAAWLAAVVGAAVLSPRLGPGDRDVAPAPNPRPVIVLMDSPLPGRVYDRRTLAAGGTNADDLTDVLRDLPVVIEKENTSPMWRREAQVLEQKPELVVSHLSCFLDERVARGNEDVLQALVDASVDRLVSFFGYVATNSPRTRFLIYSRGRFELYGGEAKFVQDVEARFPALKGRVHAWKVPARDERASFRDPTTGRLLREQVQAILGRP